MRDLLFRQVPHRGDDVEAADAEAGYEDREEGDKETGGGGDEERDRLDVKGDGEIDVEQADEGHGCPVKAPHKACRNAEAHERAEQGGEKTVSVTLIEEEAHEAGTLEDHRPQD